MRILITGATGGLGYRTLERLLACPKIETIIANGRTLKKSHLVTAPNLQYRLGSLEDIDFVDSLAKDVDVIIHAAALSSPWGKYAEFEKANVLPQQNLIAAAQKYNIQQYIYISTPSIYFENKDKFDIKETDALPPKFINAYAQTKFEAEELLKKSKIPFIILRPRALIGRGDTVIMPRLIRAEAAGRLRIIGDGKNRVDMTALANVAQAIELAIFAPETAWNRVYNISNGKPVNLWDSIESVLEKLGKKLNRKKISYPFAKRIAQLMELSSKLTNFKEPTLTVYSVGTLAKSFTMDISSANTYLGYVPEQSIDEAIDEFVTWYLEIGY